MLQGLMRKHIRFASMVAGGVAAPVGWLATHSIPQTIKDADGYFATNLKWLGVTKPPAALATSSADHTVLVVSLALMGLGLVAVGSWLLERYKRPSKLATVAFPISITAGDAGWVRHTGLDHTLQADTSLFGVGDVHITNTSPTDPVTLMFKLKGSNPTTHLRSISLSSGLVDTHRRKIGVDDLGTKLDIELGRSPRTSFVETPVTLPPMQSVHGKLAFLLSAFAMDGDVNSYAEFGMSHQTSYTLEVTDTVSGKVVEMVLPGRYPRGK